MEWKRIGMGTWPLAGDANGSVSYGKVDDEVSKEALREAFEWGINLFDTADFYGYGHVEKMMGEIFNEFRQEISIITKGGMVSNEGKQNFDPVYLLRSLFNSLDRLQTTYVDVYMLHSPPLEILRNNDLFKFLEFIKNVGYVLEYGISLRGPEDGFEAINDFGFKIIEVNYNILDMRAEESGLFDLCQKKGVKVICRTPLAQGILTGKFQFSDDKADRRNSWPKERVERQTRIYKRMMDSLNPNNYTNAQNCLRFCLTNPVISAIIPGMKTMDEVIENNSALYKPILTKEELDRIKAIYREEKL